MPVHSPRDFITVRGARQHNLKGFDVVLPKRSLVVVTGPSGSGKSSLAFDTIFAEGQRRYMESLSSYARQFLERMDKPDVETITGLSPAIAIEQRVLAKNPRSTVATQTEIYDHLRMLFAQIGKIISPISGRVVSRDTPRSTANALQSQLPDGTRFFLVFALAHTYMYEMEDIEPLLSRGFHRGIGLNGNHFELLDLSESENRVFSGEFDTLYIVVDRLIARKGDEKATGRIADSVETAYGEAEGRCSVIVPSTESPDAVESTFDFSSWLHLDGLDFVAPSPRLFSFSSPLGACKSCKGYGRTRGIDPNLVIPSPRLSLQQGAVKPIEGSSWSEFKNQLLSFAKRQNISLSTPYEDLTDSEKHLLWHGDANYDGIFGFFNYLKKNTFRSGYRFHNSRFMGFGECYECGGSRLRSEALYVQIGGKHIGQIVNLTIQEAYDFLNSLSLTPYEQEASSILLDEIKKRLRFLIDVGLHYITLGRLSETLSGGESQRIRLATALGSALVGALYVLDEPTIGLHTRDTHRLVNILKRMRDLGNTVIVVEHDPDVIRSADHIIDLGPQSGSDGGELIFEGDIDALLHDEASKTGAFIVGNESISIPQKRRKPNWDQSVVIKGASANNLKNLDLKFPLGVITCVTGVSGSGKSSLVNEILYRGLKNKFEPLESSTTTVTPYKSIIAHHSAKAVRIVDQSPIGRSSRSNPVTYINAFDIIRLLFSRTEQAMVHNHDPGFFSFNVPGGRCEECSGEGTVKVEMQFLADLYLPCDECNGTRYSDDALQIYYNGKNIYDVLNMTVDESIKFFGDQARLCHLLTPLQTIGLGYLKLGQPAPTLSGGEAQRIKLASCLAQPSNYHVVYIFDEPTTGLHFVDVEKLINAFQQLADAGHTVVIIEHNLDTLKCADHIIDLGPEGGNEGGYIVASGTPEDIVDVPESYTGHFLAPLLNSAS